VCLSVCLSVRKSLSVDILRKSWPIWMKITVYVAIAVESGTSPNQYNRTIISPEFGAGGDLCNSLNPYISKTIRAIEKQRTPPQRKIWRSTNLILYIFLIFLTFFFRYFEKNCFWKRFCQGTGVAKTSWPGSNNVLNICPNWESRVSPGWHSRGNISQKLGVGVFYTFFWTPLSQKRFEISKCAKQVKNWKFKDLQNWFYTFFRYL